MNSNKSKRLAPQALQAGDYYYTAEGLMVFTTQYHLRRGFCCGSGCRHCPWREGQSREQKDCSTNKEK